MSTDKEFKKCSSCGQIWQTREEFVEDPETKMVGYQVSFPSFHEGLFLFDHKLCETSLAIRAGEFKDFYDGPIYSERSVDTEDCPQYCLYKDNLERCPAKCECAYVREIIQIVKNWPKKSNSPESYRMNN